MYTFIHNPQTGEWKICAKDDNEQTAGYLLALLISNAKYKIFATIRPDGKDFSYWQLQRSAVMEQLTNYPADRKVWWEYYTEGNQVDILFGGL